jgi:glycosyltransferase involved in cell wall biosynthesis
MRLALVHPALVPGGAERVISHLANYWAGQGETVHMILCDGPSQPIYYELAPEVQLFRLDLSRDSRGPIDAVIANLHRVRRLRQALQEIGAEVVVAFLPETNVLATLSAKSLGIKVVVSERNSTVDEPLRPPWPLVRSIVYRFSDSIVFQTERGRDAFSPALRAKSIAIPNPVILPSKASAALDATVITAVGRLVPQKGFDLLLEAFATVAPRYPTWSLVIWGEGPEQARLEALRDQLGLQGRVILPGVTAEPGAWMRMASIFVLSSRYEGFPNVLCEAMAAGHAVIAVDCRFGPREIVTDDTDGLLVAANDPRALADALVRLMADPALRRRLAAAARQSIQRFTLEKIMPYWTALLQAMMSNNYCE